MNTFQKWIANELKLVCATSAFGMGIDKPDVRFVLHVQMPLQPEAYFQEAGRAGRDGKEAFSKIFWNDEDVAIASKRLLMKFPDVNKVAHCYELICQGCDIHFDHPIGSAFAFNVIAFCNEHKMDPWLLNGSIKMLESANYLTMDMESLQFTEIKIIATPDAVRDFIRLEITEAQLLNCLLGMHGRLFERMTKVNEYALATTLECSIEDIKKMLYNLQSDGWIYMNQSHQESTIRLLQQRVRSENLILENDNTAMLKQREFVRAGFMRDYLISIQCRSQLLLQYFGEVHAENCGICDVCLTMEITDRKIFKSWLISIVKQNMVPISELKSMLYRRGWKKEYGFWLRELLDDGSFLLSQNQCIQVRD